MQANDTCPQCPRSEEPLRSLLCSFLSYLENILFFDFYFGFFLNFGPFLDVLDSGFHSYELANEKETEFCSFFVYVSVYLSNRLGSLGVLHIYGTRSKAKV